MTKNDAVERADPIQKAIEALEAALRFMREFYTINTDTGRPCSLANVYNEYDQLQSALIALQTSRPDAVDFIKTLERIADMAGDYGTPNGLHDYVCNKLQQMRAKNGP